MPVPAFIRKHWIALLISAIVILPVAYIALKATIALGYTYSNGTRAGVLQKISRRGWLCKTWEGELQLTAVPGAAPEIFSFSTRSDSIAKELTRLSGQRIAVEYNQHKGVPTSCFGDTEYYVVAVRPVGP